MCSNFVLELRSIQYVYFTGARWLTSERIVKYCKYSNYSCMGRLFNFQRLQGGANSKRGAHVPFINFWPQKHYLNISS